MQIFNTVAALQQFLNEHRQQNAAIGFTPTMGALHAGHLSLVRRAVAENDISVCSIFVNPTQFDDKADLDRYPRTLDTDTELLRTAGNHVIFAPTANEMYPPGLDTQVNIDFGKMATQMEGAHRTGHFEGVAQVVNRLVNIVQPHKMYMGQKDFQQQAIIKHLMRAVGSPTEVITCPIVRETDGLAMSSRNRHLTPTERQNAAHISRTLRWATTQIHRLAPHELIAAATHRLNNIEGASVDYFELVDADTLLPVTDFAKHTAVVACTTVRIGKVRLLDNMYLLGD